MAKHIRQFRLKRLVSVIRGILDHRWGYACTAAACLPAVAMAGPTGEQVVAGAAAVTRPDATTTNILQSTNKAIINWQSFSIGGQEYVQFTQPSSTAIALNRVVGGDPSQILGHLSANGRIFLVNPHGVYFGPGARVDVNGLVASVLDIKDEDFMAGNYAFARTKDNPDGAGVVNDGHIKTGDGGFVVLAGGKVDNSGLIEARMGTIALASGNRLTLTVGDTGLVDVAVDEKAVDKAAGVSNAGQLIADGGRVLMTAKVAEDLVTTAVNNDGLVQARSIQQHDGVITLSATGGNVVNNGTLDASGENGQAGGQVAVTSDKNIDLANGSAIHADGDGNADGGNVSVIADGKLAFRKDALISAKAGSAQGNGGFVELSGHGGVSIRGKVEVGKGGTYFIDPTTINIVTGSSGSISYGGSLGYGSTIGIANIESALNSNTTVRLQASDGIVNMAGNATITGTGTGDLYMWVTNAAPNSGINLTGLNINIRGNVVLGASHVVTGGGTFVGSGDVKAGNLTSQNANVQVLSKSGNLTVGNVSAAGWASFNVKGNGAISTGTVSASSYVEVSVANNGNINVAKVMAGGGYADLHVGSNGAITAGDVSAGSYVNVTADGAGDINVGNVNATGTASFYANSGNVTTKGVKAVGSIYVDGRNITINGIMQAASGSSLGGSVYLYAGQSVKTGPNGRVEGYIQVDGFEGMPGPIDVSIVTRSPEIHFGNSSTSGLSGPKRMNVKVNNSAYTGATTAIFNAVANYTQLSFGTVDLTFGGNGTIMTKLNPMVVDSFSANSLNGSLTLNNANLQALSSSGIMLHAPGSISLLNSMLSAPTLTLESDGGGIAASGASLTGSTHLDIHAAGNVSAGSLSGGYVEVKSSGGGLSASTVSADSLEVHTHGNVSLGSVTVRSGALPGVGDTVLLDLMQGAGLALPTSASGNAVFQTDGNISINSLTLTDPYPYIAFALNGTLDLGSLDMSGTEILAQFTTNDPALSIGVESLASTLQDVNFNKADHFSKFPGTTIAIGVGQAGNQQLTQQGDIIIGANGPINLGTKNFVCLTVGQCIGLDKVITSGKVLSLASASLFNVPLPQEFNNTDSEKKKDEDLFGGGDDEGEGGGQSLVTQNSGSEKMCQ